MRAPVRVDVDDAGIARIAVDNPPVNALSHPVRLGLMKAVEQADADPAVRAIVLAAEGRTFPAGADIKEFNARPADPWLPELCDRIEACSKPVIAAIHGTALGGGFEVALAAHYRIALDRAQLGLPEVTLGLLPGAGGTQRLPRLAGGVAALDMMLVGKPVSAAEGARLGLIDRVVRGDLKDASAAYARELLNTGGGVRSTRDRTDGLRDVKAVLKALAERRAKAASLPVPAAARIIECVEAALLLPFEAGRAFEEAAFEDCLGSSQSQGLRHAFLSERLAAKVPEAQQAQPLPVYRLALQGRGPALLGLTVMALDGPAPVTLVSPAAEVVVSQVERVMEDAVTRRRMSDGVRGERLARLTAAGDLKALADAELVLARLPNGQGARQQALIDLSQAVAPDTILGLVGGTQQDLAVLPPEVRPQAVGLVLPHAPHMTRVVEVLVGPETAPQTVMTAMVEAKRLGRVAVRCTGPAISATVNLATLRAADEMVLRGASPYDIDKALRADGFAIGPYQRLDQGEQAGHSAALGPQLAAKGWTGQQAGRGFYAHEQSGAQAVENPGLLGLLKELHGQAGATRHFPPDEIRQRIYAAMANAGAWMIQRGQVLRPSDIDVAMMLGQGYPRWRGGPMMTADETGLLAVKKTLDILAEQDADLWRPSVVFGELIKNGKHFADLNVG